MSEGTVDPRAVEALLFLSPEPLSVDTLADILQVDREDVLTALDGVAERYDDGSGLELAQVAGGWALRTRSDLDEVCDRLRQRPPEDRLSPAALETLAVVAYLEPVSRPDISRLRGVSVDSTVANLVERGLLEEAGRGHGANAMRYRTTRAFQKRFGLADRRDLPPIERFELSGAQAEDLRRTLIDSGHLAPGTVSPDEGDDVVHVLSEPGDADREERTDEAAPDAPGLIVVSGDAAEAETYEPADRGQDAEGAPDVAAIAPGEIRVSDDRWRTHEAAHDDLGAGDADDAADGSPGSGGSLRPSEATEDGDDDPSAATDDVSPGDDA